MEKQAKEEWPKLDQKWWKQNKRPLSVIGMIAASILALALIVVEVRLYGTGFAGKTLFDWLSLLGVLAVPIIVGFGVVWITRTQQLHDKENKKLQREHDQQLAEQQTQADRYLALQNQQEKVLQSYFDRMSDLLLKENLRGSEPDSEVRNVARARTLTALRALDAGRKESILLFLMESNLIRLISLKQANLQGIFFFQADFIGANLSFANLNKASLDHCAMQGVNLTGADLRGAHLGGNLVGAKLRMALLNNADLTLANLSEADMRLADLRGATLHLTDLSNADLAEANLCEATVKNTELRKAKNIKHAKLSQSNLQHIDLSDLDLSLLDLSGANLSQANLSNTDLSYTDLSGADLSYANLIDAINITPEKLEQQAKSLKGATMPDGSIHP